MDRKQLLEFHDAFCKEAKGIMERKNHDYAGAGGESPFSNFQAAERLGVCTTEQGFLVRMLDKFKRLATFADAGELHVENEGFRDACLDIVNYCILFAAYCEGKGDE